MKRLLRGIVVACFIVAIVSCSADSDSGDEIELHNQVMINGTTYEVTGVKILKANIYHFVTLQLKDGADVGNIDLSFENKTGEIPKGHWTDLDETDMYNFYMSFVGVSADLDWTSGIDIDVTISGADGGVLTVDGSSSNDSSPSFDCAFNFTGTYTYEAR